MFVFVFSQKNFAFREKNLRKVAKITKIDAKSFAKIFFDQSEQGVGKHLLFLAVAAVLF
jgi:hypothetical protein